MNPLQAACVVLKRFLSQIGDIIVEAVASLSVASVLRKKFD